jgi:lysophospholipase L1-like esterase
MKVQTVLIDLVLIGLALGFWVLVRGETITNYPEKDGTIVAFGDSLTEGVGTTEGSDYVALLSERIGETIVDLGVSGDTTTDGVARLDELLEADPRIVILLLGGNDALRRLPVETTVANLATIMETVQDTGAAVLLVGVTGGLYGSRYPDEFERLAKEYGVAYVPNILSGLIGQPDYMADAIHPNNKGHVLMADRIEPPLRELMAGSSN